MFIRQHQPFVIGLNAHLPIDMSLVDAVAVCHPERTMLDATALGALNCEVVAPQQLLTSLGITVKRHRDVGMFVTNAGFSSDSSGVGIPDPLVLGYALAIATEGKAKRVLVVGADGYDSTDTRQHTVNNTLTQYKTNVSALPVVALTKTTLALEQRSLFAPL